MLKSLIDTPKELLELINLNLKPVQKEKQENGEVFTSPKIVNEKLDNLDRYYKSIYNKSIFTISSLKWFDPANGMSIFPDKNNNVRFNINFLENYNHDYLKKFKIIMKKDNSDTEPVGGYYKHL